MLSKLGGGTHHSPGVGLNRGDHREKLDSVLLPRAVAVMGLQLLGEPGLLPGRGLTCPQLRGTWLNRAGAVGPDRPPCHLPLYPSWSRGHQQPRNLPLGWPQCLGFCGPPAGCLGRVGWVWAQRGDKNEAGRKQQVASPLAPATIPSLGRRNGHHHEGSPVRAGRSSPAKYKEDYHQAALGTLLP